MGACCEGGPMRRKLQILALATLVPLGTALAVVVGSGTAWGLVPYNNMTDVATCNSMYVRDAIFKEALQSSNPAGTGIFKVSGVLSDCTDPALLGIQLYGTVTASWGGVSTYAPTVAAGGCDVASSGTIIISWSVQPVSAAAFHTLGYNHLTYPATTITATGLYEASYPVSYATPNIPGATQQAFEVGSFTSCGPTPSDSPSSGFQGGDTGNSSQFEAVSAQDQTAITTYGAGIKEPGLGFGSQTFSGFGDFYSG